MRTVSLLLLILVGSCEPRYVQSACQKQRVQPRTVQQNRVVIAARNQAVVANVASVSQQGTTQFGYENSLQDYQTFGDPLEEDRETPVAPIRASAAQSVANSRCVSCHSATKASGGLDMTDLEALSNGQRESIRDRILSDDPDLRMPKAKPGAEFKALGKPAMDALLKWTFEASEQ